MRHALSYCLIRSLSYFVLLIAEFAFVAATENVLAYPNPTLMEWF